MIFFWLFFALITILYFGMVLLFIVGLKKLKVNRVENESDTIKLSLVISIRNEEENIDKLLDSISNQDYQKQNLEIIVVNDHSTDQSVSLIEEWKQRLPQLRLFNLPEGQTGKKNAVAHGVTLASNPIVVLTDADCKHPSGWLTEIALRFSQSDLAMLIGAVLVSTNNLFETIQALEHSSLTASTLGACAMGFPIMASSANLSFNKEKIGFNANMLNPTQTSGDDVFLLHSVKKSNPGEIGCLFSLSSIVTTNPAKSFKEFFLQRLRWASKSTAYRDFFTIFVGLLVFLFNLSLLFVLVIVCIYSSPWYLLLVSFGAKLIVDFFLLFIFLKHTSRLKLLWVFLPLQLFYPFYIVFTFIISQLRVVDWKGRGLQKMKE